MKIVYFDYAALVLGVTMLISILMNRTHRGRSNKYFFLMFLIVFLSLIFSTGSVLCDNYHANVYVTRIAHWCYLLFHNLSSVAYAVYMLSLSGKLKRVFRNRVQRFWFLAPGVVLLAVLLLSLFLPFAFSVSETDGYSRRAGMYLLYLCSITYMIYGFAHIVKYRKLFSLKFTLGLLSLAPIIGAAMIAEFLVPNLIVEMFANMIALLFVYCNIWKPGEIYHESGALNSRAFFMELSKSFATHNHFHVVYLEFVNFSYMRDKLGRRMTAELNHQVVQRIFRLLQAMKLDGQVYYLKYGSFTVILDDGQTYERSSQFADWLAATMNETLTFHGNAIKPQTSLCLVACPEDLDNEEDLSSFAIEFRRRKQIGQVQHANQVLKGDYRVMLRIDQVIDAALKERRLQVYYQPIWSAKQQKFTSAEALLRLKDPEFGFVNPELVIRAAENSGSIQNISDFVFSSVCDFLTSREGKALGLENINVNLSVAQCIEKKLADRIIKLVDAKGVPHNRLNLEITETAMEESNEVMNDNVRRLSEAGFPISIDDFGSGYSNISRLVQMPKNVVKLDRGVLLEAMNPKSGHLLSYIVALIKSFRCEIVAEGVETEEQLRLVTEQGCDYIQGYYFSKPLPREDFIRFLAGANRPSGDSAAR